MRLATDGLAEKTRNAPMKIKTRVKLSVTLSTVHHQFAMRLRLILEKANNFFSYYNNAAEATKVKTNPAIQKRKTTVVSFQPSCSK